MNAPETLCDLKILKADYRSAGDKSHPSNHVFRINVTTGGAQMHFNISERDGELFAAELEALAAIVRSRTIRAQEIAEQ
jgi:hypothetical protein